MDISETIHLLGDLLGEILIEQESQQLFEIEEYIRGLAKTGRAEDPREAEISSRLLANAVSSMDVDTARGIAGAFALYFDLVNTAEDNYRVSVLRQEALRNSPQPVHDSIEEAVLLLKESGLTHEKMDALLGELQIELVLTAHPTEARRRTILSKTARIAEALRGLNFDNLLLSEKERYRNILRDEITTLWLTDRTRSSQITPTDEVRTALYFVGQVFWVALPQAYELLQRALDKYYPGLTVKQSWLRLSSWMGGDRDGNPYVTHEVTAETLHLHRGLAVENHRQTFQDLSRRLSLSGDKVPLPQGLKAWLNQRPTLSAHASQIQKRYPNEPYRLILSLLAADLAGASLDDMKSRLLSDSPHEAKIEVEELVGPLSAIKDSVPPAVKRGPIEVALRQLDIFGLHGARLDIREDSARINTSLGEVLRALGMESNFESMSHEERRNLLVRLLEQPVPPLAHYMGVTPATSECWALFRLVQRAQSIYGKALIGPWIISMSHCSADMLAVLLMAKWTDCADGMQIVPLFETIDDLQSAPQIMRDLFTIDVYRRHLETCTDGQMVMVGYSDSNKDGGFLMSNWALYQCQEQLSQICKDNHVHLTLFHGRGGTAARGGGPTNRAILAAPGGSVNCRYRLTEQGEIITSRYSTIELALRHIEQITNAVLLASAPVCLAPDPHLPLGCGQRVSPEKLPERWRLTLQEMAVAALKYYRNLVYETPGFNEYWQAATPIEEIKRMRIGSRPASRTPGVEEVAKIRAIPWVFSWMQSRFNLPGWYGLGTGLQTCLNQAEGLNLLREMHENWPFFQVLLENAELSLSKADMQIAALYNQLVPDQDLANRLFSRITAEYYRTVEAVLIVKNQTELMQTEPVIQRSIKMRNPYVDPLNYIQVELLKRLRILPDVDGEEAAKLREAVILSINGIAAGLRNTG